MFPETKWKTESHDCPLSAQKCVIFSRENGCVSSQSTLKEAEPFCVEVLFISVC